MYRKIIVIFILISVFVFSLCTEEYVYENEDSIAASENTVTIDNEPLPVIKLESLEISPGNLSPAFNPDMFIYNLDLAPEVSEIALTARPYMDCTVEVDDVLLLPDYYRTIIPVNQPVSDISLFVSAGIREGMIYSLRVTRMEEIAIENSSFELFNEINYPSGWTMSGAGECISTGEYFNTGNYSGTFVTLTGTISGREVLSSPVEIDPDKKMIISALFYTPVSETLSSERINISFKIYYYKDAECTISAVPGSATMTKTSIKESGKWEKVKYERVPDDIPGYTRFVRIAIRACYISTIGGTKFDRVFFDNVSLQQ